MELDPKVVRLALGGDREAFQTLVQETWGLVFHFIRGRLGDREKARDLTQDTFLQAFDKRATLRNEASFISWLLTIASRKVIDAHRRKGTHPETHLADPEKAPIADPGSSPTEGVARTEDAELVHRALGLLDDRYRAVLILRYFSGLTPSQIARLLGEPEGTIRNRIFRAHARLRKHLENDIGLAADERN